MRKWSDKIAVTDKIANTAYIYKELNNYFKSFK